MTVLTVILIIIFSPLIIIAGFVSLALLWAILDFIVSSIISSIASTVNSINNYKERKK